MGHEEVERCGTAVSRLLQSLEALAENRLQGSQRGRVAGVPKLLELHTLDDLTVADDHARDDAFG